MALSRLSAAVAVVLLTVSLTACQRRTTPEAVSSPAAPSPAATANEASVAALPDDYPTVVPTAASCAFPEADQAQVQAWLTADCYKAWPHDPEIRSSGPLEQVGDKLVDDSTHHRVQIYYSDDVTAWLKAGRPATGIPDGSAIVKEMYPTDDRGPNADQLLGYSAMLKYKDQSYDGWFWSIYFLKPGSMMPMGDFGYSFCLTCHGSADNADVTFSSLDHLEGKVAEAQEIQPGPNAVGVNSSHTMGWLDVDDNAVLPDPLGAADPAFLEQYPAFPAPADPLALAFPSTEEGQLPVGANGPDQFLTSGNCYGCHDATLLLDAQSPNMIVTDSKGKRQNLSPYGEWHASMMGLSGRDPVFHAQLESEKAMRPGDTALLDNTCYRCHGVMGQRQLAIDQGRPFQHNMVYAERHTPNGKYGALARDGVSCTVCHHMSEQGLGTEATYTGQFGVGLATELYGPYTDVKVKPMQQAIGITPRSAPQISSSAMCGSCHTVILPRLPAEEVPVGTDPFTNPAIPKGHEQATYLEWRNSAYQNEQEPVDTAAARTCQSCHMPTTFDGPADTPLSFKIANIEDNTYPEAQNRLPDEDITLAERTPYSRHTLVGLNVFVLEMFQQFPEILGIDLEDPNVPNNTMASLLLASQESAKLGQQHSATVEISSVRRTADALEASVVITNLAGHKLPSGVGFRRAFLTFDVLDAAGKSLWSSGRTSPLGVILGPDGQPLPTEFSPERTEVQPHHAVITSQDQVQVYEDRYLDSNGKLTTSFVGLAEEVKDNRLLPRGWSTTAPDTDFLQPSGIDGDPRYADGSGSDEVIYRVPLAAVPGAATVTATLNYQSIPPYYLNERFQTTSGRETQRLYHLASRLNLSDSSAAGWRLPLASAEAAVSPE